MEDYELFGDFSEGDGVKTQEFNKLRTEIRGYVKKWHKALGFSSWDFDFRYKDEIDPESPETGGRCSSDWRYKHGTVTFYLPNLISETPMNREYTVIHELCHAKVNELREFAVDNFTRGDLGHEERVVTELAWAYYFTWQDATKAAKRKKK